MATPNPDDSLLLIRCPSCGQRFKVGEDLRDRTVECGGCENRFRINDEVIVRGRKFYPGERKGDDGMRFQRVPLAGGERMIGVKPMQYANAPDQALLEPMSPQRIIAGGVGVGVMACVALMLMFGAGSGGILEGTETSSRMILAGFSGLLGGMLLIYANPKARVKAGLVSLVLAAGVVALPLFFKAGTPITRHASDRPFIPEPEAEPVPAGGESPAIRELRDKIGTAPLADEIARLAKEKSEKHAIGLWLREMDESHRYLVMDYIVRISGADLSSHYYPRERGDYLMVVSGISIPLREMAELAAPLGVVEKIYPEISVIEVKVLSENFLEGPLARLTNKEDPLFYELNKRELESIDLNRMRRAVQRLAGAEPKVYRTDITRKLLVLLGQPGVDFKSDLCNALITWSDQPGAAGAAALKEVNVLLAANRPIPREMIAVAVKEKNPGVIPILSDLWFKTPGMWETLYGDVGPAAERSVIARFAETQGAMRHSAARLLGRVGGVASLPVLDGATAGADNELKVIIEQSRKAIRDRIGN